MYLFLGSYTIRLQFKAFAGRVNVGHSNYLGPYSQQGGPERNCPFGPPNFVMLAVLSWLSRKRAQRQEPHSEDDEDDKPLPEDLGELAPPISKDD